MFKTFYSFYKFFVFFLVMWNNRKHLAKCFGINKHLGTTGVAKAYGPEMAQGISLMGDIHTLIDEYPTHELKKDLKKFITPSLRNLTHTKPYSHDGRLLTLEEVIDHYSNPPHLSETLDPRLPKEGLQLSDNDKAALIAFLKTLSDPKY